MQEQNSIEKKK